MDDDTSTGAPAAPDPRHADDPESAVDDDTSTGAPAAPDPRHADDPESAVDDGDVGVPIRVVLAKLGLDGHDRGLKVVARMLRDAGMEVIYLGLRQTTETVIAAVEQEDADAIGLSMHNAGHLALAPRILEALAEAGLDIPVIIGGIVPSADVAALTGMGISAVLHPGSSVEEVVEAVRRSVA